MSEQFQPMNADPMVRVQELYVRLYFSESLQIEWATDRQAVMKRFDLTEKHASWIPDTSSPEFAGECHGRRMFVARELSLPFNGFFTELLGEPATGANIVNHGLFRKFLASDEFLTSTYAMVHYMGLGKGHESSSKFFLWARKYFSAPDTLDDKLNHTLHVDFARRLQLHARLSGPRFLQLAAKGVAFALQGGTKNDWSLLTPRGELVDVCLADASELHSRGILDLDGIDEYGDYLIEVSA